MPILWRYLILTFSKIAILCVLSFVGILLTMRFDEIAHFTTLGASWLCLLNFTLYQIPYILPIAIPLSCLIASMLLVQRISHSHELTALRACHYSLLDILAPILITTAFLSVANFWIASELATQSHLKTNLLKTELRSINPLFFLKNKHIMRPKGFYFDALNVSRLGESASQVILAIPNKKQQRLNLLIANKLQSTPSTFTGEGVTLLTGSASEAEDDFDNLLIENIGKAVTRVDDFANFLHKKVWTVNNDYLSLSLLLARIKEQRQGLMEAKNSNNTIQLKALKLQYNQSLLEIIKRFSIAIAVFSFTLMGMAFGINISRKRRNRILYLAIFLAITFLVSFFIARGLDRQFWLAAILFIFPHFIMIFSSIAVLGRVTRGIE